MDLATLRLKTQDLVAEKSSDKGLIDSTAGQNLDRYLNSAALAVWRLAISRQPQLFQVRGAQVTFVAATGYLDPATFTGSASTVVHKIRLVEVLQGATWYPVLPFDDPNQRFENLEPVGPVPVPAGSMPWRWFQEQERVYLSPPPTADLSVRVTYVAVPAAMVADADVPLSGRLDEFHDLVALEAACSILRRDEHMKTPYDDDRDRVRGELVTALSRSQGQRTRRVRVSGSY